MSLEDIQTRYNQICGQLGDIHYKIKVLQVKAHELLEDLTKLDQEYGKLTTEARQTAETATTTSGEGTNHA